MRLSIYEKCRRDGFSLLIFISCRFINLDLLSGIQVNEYKFMIL